MNTILILADTSTLYKNSIDLPRERLVWSVHGECFLDHDAFLDRDTYVPPI